MSITARRLCRPITRRRPTPQGSPITRHAARALAGLAVVAFVGCSGPSSSTDPIDPSDLGEANASLSALGDAETAADEPVDDTSATTTANSDIDQDLVQKSLDAFDTLQRTGTWPTGDDASAAEGAPAPGNGTTGQANAAFALPEDEADAGMPAIEGAGDTTTAPAGVESDAVDPDPANSDATAESAAPPSALEAGRVLVERLLARSDETEGPFYHYLALTLAQIYAPGTYELGDPPDELTDEQVDALRAVAAFAESVHNDVYREDAVEPLVAAVREMAAQLDRHLPMTIPVMAICRRVDGYGQYEPMPGALLVAQPRTIGIYTELDNFTTRIDEAGQHHIEIAQTIALYKEEDGTKAWAQPTKTFRDVSSNRRRDYFLAVAVRVPALSIGTYRLKVTMEDLNSGAVAEKAVDLTVVADLRAAPGS